MNYLPYLSYSELERYAYLAGDGFTAVMAETADDLKRENTAYEEREERIKTEAFEDGKLEGLGVDTQAAFREQTTQINDLKTHLGHAKELLGTCHAWLTGDQGKTIKGRREAAHALSSGMVMRGLGYPQH